MKTRWHVWPLAALLASGCVAPGSDVAMDLGDFDALGKSDAVDVDVPFEIAPDQVLEFDLRTVGRLDVALEQPGHQERLQLVAESASYRRRSWRGQAPFIRIPGSQNAGRRTEYTLRLLNWGEDVSRGTLHITTIDVDAPGVTLVANQPDCEGCEDPAGELRTTILDAIQNASVSIDLAIYGIDDPAIVEALCEASLAGVRVRVVSDSAEATLEEQRYFAALRGEESLASCGVPVELTDYSGIMHNKYFVIDAGTDAPVLITGSTNQTTADLEVNHNHSLVLRGNDELLAAYTMEFEQLFTHCAASGCGECTPVCAQDLAPEGPFIVGDASVRVFFSPSDDALTALRGPTTVRRRVSADPACGPESDCLCRRSGSAWQCHYCGLEGDFGLVGNATERVLATVYAITDPCFVVGMAHARDRGVETTLVIDKVNSGSPFSTHSDACAMGIPTFISEWNEGSAQARNHHKLVVVDDVVVTGSMNLSAAGVSRNHENTLFLDDEPLAERAAQLIEDEAALLRTMGVDGTCR